MHEHWLPEWRKAQRQFLTPQNFDDVPRPEEELEGRVREFTYPSRHVVASGRPNISFDLPAVNHLGKVVRGEVAGEFYGRAGFEELRSLELGLVAAEAGYMPNAHDFLKAAVFPSGMSAIDSVARELVRHTHPAGRHGKRFLKGKTLYTHSHRVFDERMTEYGFAPAIAVDTTQPETVEAALKQRRGEIVAIYFEPVTNPLIEYTDTRAVADIARKYGVPVVVDNTFFTPYLQQPFRMGADIVIHSMTKYMSGYGDMLAGAVVGPKGFMGGLKELQVQDGAVVQTPDIAQELFHRLALLPRRMREHARNARTFANFLEICPTVARVYHPNLSTATRFGSAGGVVTFQLAGATADERTRRETALIQYLIDHNHEPIAYAVSLGEKRHLMIGETTLGLPSSYEPGLVRFAVGREPKAEEVIPFLKDALDSVSQ